MSFRSPVWLMHFGSTPRFPCTSVSLDASARDRFFGLPTSVLLSPCVVRLPVSLIPRPFRLALDARDPRVIDRFRHPPGSSLHLCSSVRYANVFASSPPLCAFSSIRSSSPRFVDTIDRPGSFFHFRLCRFSPVWLILFRRLPL